MRIVDISYLQIGSRSRTRTVQFRAEALNAFNTPQFRAANTASAIQTLARITPAGNFPRYLQLGEEYV